MLTRDEVVQLILYLIVATVLLLASRLGAETFNYGSHSVNIWDDGPSGQMREVMKKTLLLSMQ